MTVTAILALVPVLLVLVLLLKFRMSADLAGMIALALTVLLAAFWCQTAPNVMLRAALSGLIASLPVVLVMGSSMFQIMVMEEAGAMQRLVALLKGMAPGERVVQLMLINVGFGILLTSLGATTVAILPPIMIALGYSSFVAVAMPAIGYQALCTYALLGVPVVVHAGLAQTSMGVAGASFAMFMPVMALCISFGMLWLIGGWREMVKGWLPALITSLLAGLAPLLLLPAGLVTLTGVFAGALVIAGLLIYLKLRGAPLSDASMLDAKDWQAVRDFSLLRAFSPWLLMIVVSLLLNLHQLPLFNLTFVKLAMPVELIPGAPERIRLFWQPWFWVFVSTFACLPLLRMTPAKLSKAASKAWKRGYRPCLAAVLFFMLAYIMNHSGKNADWQLLDSGRNMIASLAEVSANALGGLYPAFAPFLGLLGGFIAGSQTSSLAMFTGLHMQAAGNLGANGILLAAASGIGGGMASVLSPSKVSLGAASIESPHTAAEVMRKSLPVVLVTTLILGLMTMFLA